LHLPEDVFEPCGVNNVLHVSLEDLPALRQREDGYDLHPVACSDWAEPHGDAGLAWILVAPDPPGDAPLEPHRRYYGVCRAGAAGMGPAFLAAWLRTTYLADGVTPVEDWERREPRV
jgi:DNA-binding transcriptional LysR family regulator